MSTTDLKLKYKIMAALRRVFLFSSQHYQIKRNSQIIPGIHVCDGCGCAVCLSEKTDDRVATLEAAGFTVTFDKMHVDHIQPVISVESGGPEIDWSAIINSLFCSLAGLQHLCASCHYLKTQVENEERRANS